MDYKYMPDTYKYNLMMEKYETKEQFILSQIKYRRQFIKTLLGYINSDEINKSIKSSKYGIPKVNDAEYNFYHLEKVLNNDYIYLRNNIHTENLNKEEINYLLSNNNLGIDFFNKTIEKVLYEDTNKTFYGIARKENLVNSKSLIFEFAYNQLECQTVEQLKEIEKVINECFEVIKKNLKEKLNITPSFIIYNAVTDIYKDNNKSLI